jgi:hypothetical protein
MSSSASRSARRKAASSDRVPLVMSHGIDYVRLECPPILLLRPDLLQVLPAYLLPCRQVRDDDGLADQRVVANEVFIGTSQGRRRQPRHVGS